MAGVGTDEFDRLFASFVVGWGPVDWSVLAAPEFEFVPTDARFANVLQGLAEIEDDSRYQARKVRRAGFGDVPGLGDFLVLWQAEESEHGRMLRHVAHRLGAEDDRPPPHQVWSELRVPTTFLATVAARVVPDLVGVYGALGAAQEHVACVTYRYLADQVATDELRSGLTAVARQESRHLRFYRGVAEAVLGPSERAQRLTRTLLARFWRPPGVDVLGEERFAEAFGVLLENEDYRTRTLGLDRLLDQLPGLDDLRLMSTYLESR